MPSLQELAVLVNGEIVGDGLTPITGVAGIEDAKPGDITFAASHRVVGRAVNSPATALIIPANVSDVAKPALKVANPRLAFARILTRFFPPAVAVPSIHPTAVIGANFNGTNCEIDALVYIGDNVTIGAGSIIRPGVVIEDGVAIGKNALIHASVVIRTDCVLGDNVQVHSGTVIGEDGFGYVTVDGQHVKIPQVGRVVIESDVEIGANVTIDRATTGVTLIKRGTKIDNQVQVAHNCELGENNLLCGQVGLAGSAKLGDRVTLAGKAGVVGHIELGDDTVVAACSMVIGSVPPHSFVSGSPARTHAADMRNQAAIGRLPELLKDFKEMQKRLAELERRVSSEK
ncbi:MAG: UDP-3-O-(3-hydroxymyristoyl)glucosamine N-acyltransferase [Bacillota bacterium]|jgi:UDP-3-O-[3-hydroxymyristoyl] glucosamine N-acyltransferase